MAMDEYKSNSHLTYGSFSLEGDHHPNEDRCKVKRSLYEDSEGNVVFYAGLFDGHGGAMCAEFCKRNMHRNILKELRKMGDISQAQLRDEMMVAALLNAFAKTEEDFLQLSVGAKEFSGACANVILLYRDTIYVANLGDCRCVLGRTKGKSIGLSRDHKASIEKNRIRKIGGFVKNGRVNGVLAISRTIGDREFKDPIQLGSSPKNGNSNGPAPMLSYRPGQSLKSASLTNVMSQASPSTRRISSPNTILLKNVRDTAESPTRTRHRPIASSSGSITRSNSSCEDVVGKGSASREPSPIPFSPKENSKSTPSPSRSPPPSEIIPVSASKTKKRRSGSVKVPPTSVTESESVSESQSQSSQSLTDSPGSRTATGRLTPSASLPALIESVLDGTDEDTTTRSAASSSDDETPSVGSPGSGASGSGLTSSNGGDGEVIEGMFDVIECYDAESKQRKFGFKKRRPPKDPKYDVGTLVSAIPEITIMRRTSEDDWLFLASDGFYDLFSTKQAGVAVTKHLQRTGRDRLSDTVKALCDEASLLGSEDDITGILLLFKSPNSSSPINANGSSSSTSSSSRPSPLSNLPTTTTFAVPSPFPSPAAAAAAAAQPTTAPSDSPSSQKKQKRTPSNS
jgi:serine/threonine protein phosphatase PrpC